MGRVAIVTGSDSGIGQEPAVALAEAGCDVGVTWHRDQAGADETSARIRAAGRKAAVARLDLADGLPEAGGVVDRLAGELGGLDVLVDNAGTSVPAPFLEQSLEDWQRVLDTDLTGVFVCAQAAARRMVAAGRGSRIVNVTSVHEHVPLEHAAAIAWIASEEATYVTGSSLVVDGGLLLMAAMANTSS